jgi:hypothetical protein
LQLPISIEVTTMSLQLGDIAPDFYEQLLVEQQRVA